MKTFLSLFSHWWCRPIHAIIAAHSRSRSAFRPSIQWCFISICIIIASIWCVSELASRRQKPMNRTSLMIGIDESAAEWRMDCVTLICFFFVAIAKRIFSPAWISMNEMKSENGQIPFTFSFIIYQFANSDWERSVFSRYWSGLFKPILWTLRFNAEIISLPPSAPWLKRFHSIAPNRYVPNT